jgi:phosphoglycerol transferase MdoB-like AlkP superfamily enzyme
LENFYNYQYSSNCLGDFISKIKGSFLKDQTIISATGDHNTWMLFHYTEKSLHRKFGVPFYLYAPQRYLQGKQIDTHRFGSHKDIFPTLFNLSLSDEKYFNSGNDLLTNNWKTLFFGINEKSIAVDKNGLIENLNSTNPRFFSWENNKHSVLEVNQESSNALLKASKSRQVLINYYFNELLWDQ